MKFALDHVVIAVTDLARAVEDYRALGFTVAMGGRHPGRTSHNALVVFEDGSYLELIAWMEPGPAERWYDEHARHGDGVMDFALVPEDTARAIAEAKARGLALIGPLDGGRLRPDGQQVKWRTGRQETFDLPFLCGDVTPRGLRVPEGEVRRHANGVTGIAKVRVAVRDPEASLARYAALLGPETRPDGTPASRADPLVEMPSSGIRWATVRLGGTGIVLLSPPVDPHAPAGTLVTMLRERLATRGEGPFSISLAAPGAAARTFDERLAHGAHIDIGL
jgi:catechol 2,3-dioxygenase-like lactoylglutathione lyase family enzyme